MNIITEVDVEDSTECPCCASQLTIDTREVSMGRWAMTRTYACGCRLTGVVGEKLRVDIKCPHASDILLSLKQRMKEKRRA